MFSTCLICHRSLGANDVLEAFPVGPSTDNIGLATLKEGLDLIRIGKPLRPELSAWRYGLRILARRRKAALMTAGGAVMTGVASVLAVGAFGAISDRMFDK